MVYGRFSDALSGQWTTLPPSNIKHHASDGFYRCGHKSWLHEQDSDGHCLALGRTQIDWKGTSLASVLAMKLILLQRIERSTKFLTHDPSNSELADIYCLQPAK